MAEEKKVGSIQRQQLKIKQQMREDIMGTQNVADQLTGKQPIGSKKLQKTDAKKTQPVAKVDTKKLEKFLDFMEDSYKGGTSKVEIKRKI